MAKMKEEFLKERAEQLAIIYLTRRDDVRVLKNPTQSGTALLASLLHDGQDVGRYLGVEVAGTVSERGLKRLEQTIEIDPGVFPIMSFHDTASPSCLFFFTMQDDLGYWKWLQEPMCDNQRAGSLSVNQSTTLVRLTNQDLETIWIRVEEWYQTWQQLVAA